MVEGLLGISYKTGGREGGEGEGRGKTYKWRYKIQSGDLRFDWTKVAC